MQFLQVLLSFALLTPPIAISTGFDWTVPTCKKANIDLLEYPIFWQGHTPIDNTRKTAQQASSPLRVVYVNDRGTAVYCGVMTHTQAKKQESVDRQESWRGLAGFAMCT